MNLHTIRIKIEPQHAERIIALAKAQMPALLHLRTKTPNVHQFSSPDLHDIYKLGLLNGAFFKDKITAKP
jgi:hypothetical protein